MIYENNPHQKIEQKFQKLPDEFTTRQSDTVLWQKNHIHSKLKELQLHIEIFQHFFLYCIAMQHMEMTPVAEPKGKVEKNRMLHLISHPLQFRLKKL